MSISRRHAVAGALRTLRVLSRVPTKLFGVMGHRERLRRWSAKRMPIELEIQDFDGTMMFRCDLGEHIGSHIFWRDAYSVDVLRCLDRRLEPDMTLLDVGANQGEVTLFAAKRLHRGRVIALEPVSWLHARLVEHVHANGLSNVQALRVGLGRTTATVPIYAQAGKFSDGTVNSGLPSLFEGGSRTTRAEDVEIVPLDTLAKTHPFERLDFVKIDVEGGELDALIGGEETILVHRPRILMELAEDNCQRAGHSMNELLEWIGERGYETFRLGRDGRAVPLVTPELHRSQNVLCQMTR